MERTIVRNTEDIIDINSVSSLIEDVGFVTIHNKEYKIIGIVSYYEGSYIYNSADEADKYSSLEDVMNSVEGIFKFHN